MDNIKHKSPIESVTVTSHMVMPQESNPLGNLMGGHLMYFIDMVAAMAAAKHAEKNVVTVYVDDISFKHPVKVGSFIEFVATVVWTGTTSLKTEVEVYFIDYKTGEKKHTNSANLTFVAVDENMKPSPVPKLLCLTIKEKEKFKKYEEMNRLRVKSEHDG